MLKKAEGMQVTLSGDAINGMADIIGRRMVTQGERSCYLIDEATSEFKLNDLDVYLLKAELTNRGFQIEINEEIWGKPIERRTSLGGITKIAKVYGSRFEDVAMAVANIKQDIKELKSWIKENECERYKNPQTYYTKAGMLESSEVRLKDLEGALKIVKSPESYVTRLDMENPVTVLGFEQLDTLYAIVKTADGKTAPVMPNEITNTNEMAKDEEEDIAPNTEVGYGTGLNPVEKTEAVPGLGEAKAEKKLTSDAFEAKDPIQSAIKMVEETGNQLLIDAFKAVDTVESPTALFEAAIENLKKADTEDNSKREDLISQVKDVANKLGFTLNASQLPGRFKYADFRFPEKTIASSLMTFERMSTTIKSLIGHNVLKGNVKLADSLRNLDTVVNRASEYVKGKLKYSDPIEKEAAAILLKKIANSLDGIKKDLDEVSAIPEANRGYIIASFEPKIAKVANMLLLVEEE